MTQTGYANAIVNAMLGWLKGLASWVLRLFNLSGGFSPLKFLADNWLKLLIVLLALGVALDLLVWLIRWRPHWVWFRKKRVIINDRNFFAEERQTDSRRQPERRSGAPMEKPRRNWEDSDFVVRSAAARRRADRQRAARDTQETSLQADARPHVENRDVFQDDQFNVNAKQRFSDMYEDEVFNVSNLPRPEKKPRTQRRGEEKGAQRANRKR